MAACNGIFRLHYLFDIGEGVDLGRAGELLSDRVTGRGLRLPSPTPSHVGFVRPPLSVALQAPEPGQTLSARIFEHGIVSMILDLPFALPWPELPNEAARLLDDAQLGERLRQAAQGLMGRCEEAVDDRYAEWLSEEYLTILVRNEQGGDANSLLQEHGAIIAQTVRGELQPLSGSERDEVLNARLSCYQTDLVVAGWAAAFVYDSEEGAETVSQLLEFANTQLLDFRHYDARVGLILRQLSALSLSKRRWWQRWSLQKEAERLNLMRLEIAELASRSDDALRLFGDMYFARLHRIVLQRIGAGEFRRQMEAKLHAAAEYNATLIEGFNHQRAYLLELTVVIILIIELGMALAGLRGHKG